jgi:aminopeptidase N
MGAIRNTGRSRAITWALLGVTLLSAWSVSSARAAGDGMGRESAQPDVDSPASPEAAPDGRLPTVADLRHVSLDLVVDPRADRFAGVVVLDVELAAPVGHLWLHGKELNVRSVRLTDYETGQQGAGTWRQVLDSGVARLDFPEATYGPGRLSIEIAYDAPFDRNLSGLFAVEEAGEYYALAKSESIQARKFLPGFDEPAYKAPYDVTLTVPAGYVAIANGREVARGPADVEGMERVSFATTRPLPTYLLSIAVGPFDLVERDPLAPNDVRRHPVPLRGVARKGKGAELDYILSITPDFVRMFEQALGVPYPYAKLDIVAAPQWPSGATELAAAISYREQRILARGTPPPAARRALISVHAHELAHMWFGNLVTPPWWDDLWLKEGFATWATPFVLTQWEPEAGHDLTARASVLDAMQTDSLASARSVRGDIAGNADIRNAYTAITYRKGMGLIAMADAYFGPQRFRPALGQYVRRFADGVADSPAFFQAIGEATGAPALTASFRSFVEQSGVPTVGVRLQCGESEVPRVVLTQRRYAPLGSAIDPQRRWVVPVCVAYGPGPGTDPRGRACTLMREETEVLELGLGVGCPTWLHPNAAGAGYYRWTLDPAVWDVLTGAFDELTPAEAMVAVDSATAAFEAGELDATTLLELLLTAVNHHERLVATRPMQAFEAYQRNLLASEDAERMRGLAADAYAARLRSIAAGGGEEERLLQQALIAFLAEPGRDAQVREELTTAAAAFVGLHGVREPRALESDRYELAFTVAVQEIGAPFFDQLLAVRERVDDPRLGASSAVALGRAVDATLRERAQGMALTGELGARETWSLVSALFEAADGREAVWAWYRENFRTLLEHIPAQWRRRTPAVGGHFCTHGAAEELTGFFAEVGPLVSGYERSLAQTVERIRLCAALRASRQTELALALRSVSGK